MSNKTYWGMGGTMANSLAPSKDGGLNIFIVGHGDVMCEIEKKMSKL